MTSIVPFIHRKPVILREDRSVYEASRAMCDQRVGCVIVTDGRGHMTGVLTDRDLACDVFAMNFSPDMSVGDAMTKSLVKACESSTVKDVVELMKKFGVRRIPITRETNGIEKCIGLVSLDDLLAAELISAHDVAQIVKSQIWRRARRLDLSEREPHLGNDPDMAKLIDIVSSKTSLGKETSEGLINVVASLIVRRLSYSLAADFIALLPKQLQSMLLDLPAGPDLSVTPDHIREAVTSGFDVTADRANDLLKRVWDSLFDFTDKGRLNLIADQVPDELKILFTELTPGIVIRPQKLDRHTERGNLQ